MSNSNLDVKEEKFQEKITIQRGKHDRENPYVMISKKMLRDIDISPKAKGILCFLLSLPDNWVTHPRQIAESMGVGKDQVYSALNELLKFGYATKAEVKTNGTRFGNVIYEFYEEKLPEAERFQKKITVSGNPDTGNPDTGIQTLKKKEFKEDISQGYNSSLKVPSPPDPIPIEPSKEESAKASEVEQIKKRTPSDFSPKIREVGQKLLDLVSQVKPDWPVPKNLFPFLTQIDFMIRLDKRDPQKMQDVFAWALSDSFWCDKMIKPNPAKYLREKFDQLDMKMNAKPPKKERRFAPSSTGNALKSELYKEFKRTAL